MPAQPDAPERADLLEVLAKHRWLFRVTAQGLTDDQARQQTSVSTLTVGGLIKHVSATEAQWADFVVRGAVAHGGADWSDASSGDDDGAGDAGDGSPDGGGWDPDSPAVQAYFDGFRLLPDETLAGVLAEYEAVAARTDELVRTVDLNSSHPLPSAPWFEQGASWSARRVFIHIAVETAQHAGHADIIREGIDGQKSMG